MQIFDIKKLTPLKKAYLKYLTSQLKTEKLPASFVSFIEALSKQKFHSQQELSEYLGCNKAHTSRTLFKMQLKGFVKLTCGKNGIELTEKGKSITLKLASIENEFVNILSQGITDSERKTFGVVLDKMIANSNMIGG